LKNPKKPEKKPDKSSNYSNLSVMPAFRISQDLANKIKTETHKRQISRPNFLALVLSEYFENKAMPQAMPQNLALRKGEREQPMIINLY
jgi:hypothetical protein